MKGLIALLSLFAAAAVCGADVDTANARTLRLPVLEAGRTGLSLGPEFPGARGTLAFEGNGAKISYNLSSGGRYVGFCLPQPIDEGGCVLTAEFRGECPSDYTVLLRGEDEKRDVHVQSVKIPPSRDWRRLSFDLTKFTGHFGRSTNAAERARTAWPLHNVCVVVQPVVERLKGTVEMRDLQLTTTVSKKRLPSWDATVASPRFGALYYPEESVEFSYAVRDLEVGRKGPPSVTPDQLRVIDWRDRSVYVRGLTAPAGKIVLPPDVLGGRFGAFKVVIGGRDVDSNECEVARTWFARLTGPNPAKPVKWIGTGIHGWGSDMRRYDLMVAAGIGAIRNDALWRECERRPGVYCDPNEHFAANIQALKTRGIVQNIGLTHPNPVAYPDSPLDPDAHAAFCEWFAKAHPDVDSFEIFNEGWSFGFHQRYKGAWIEKLVEYNRKAAPRLHRARPDAAVLVASDDGWGGLSRQIQLGIAEKDDVVSFHPYIHGADPRPERENFFWGNDGAELKELLAAHGGATRLMITEVGWTTYGVDENGESECWFVGGYPGVSYEAQARYLIRAYLLARSAGVEAMFQYDFHDDGPRRNYTEHNFGMVFRDYTPKPSFAAVAFMARLVGDAEPLGEVGKDRSKYRMLSFRLKDGRAAYAMWAIEDPVKVRLPADAVGGMIYDLMGNGRPLNPARTEIELVENPHYVVCP